MKYHKIKKETPHDKPDLIDQHVRGNKKTFRSKKIALIRETLEKASITTEIKAKNFRILRSKLADRQAQVEALQQTNKKLRAQVAELQEYKMLWENRKIRKESSGRKKIYLDNSAETLWKEYVYSGKTIREVASSHTYTDNSGKLTKMSTKTCTELIHRYDHTFYMDLLANRRKIKPGSSTSTAELKQLRKIVKRLQSTHPEAATELKERFL